MATPPGDKRPPARVQVIHFPKKARPSRRTRTLEALSLGNEVTKTLPEIRPGGASESGRARGGRTPVLADPDGELTQPDERAPTRERRGREKERRGRERRGEKRRKKSESETISEVSASRPPRSRQKGPGSKEIAEASLFGHHLFEAGRLDEARGVFEQLVEAGVKEAFPHTMLGTVYLAQGDHDRALALFEAALVLDRRDVAARVYRGEIRLNRGNLRHAVEDLRDVLRTGDADDPFVDRARRLLEVARSLAAKRR